jgi:Ca2+-binding RTX toxin-like protein
MASIAFTYLWYNGIRTIDVFADFFTVPEIDPHTGEILYSISWYVDWNGEESYSGGDISDYAAASITRSIPSDGVFTLSASVDNFLTGEFLSRSVSVQIRTGAAQNQFLYGGSGEDAIFGSYAYADVINLGASDDYADGFFGDDFIRGGAGNDRMNGGAGSDTIVGEAGNDMLDGGTGDDILIGGGGNDWYYFEDADTILEGVGGGNDTVYTWVTFNLGTLSNVENLLLDGIGNLNATGTAGANILKGNFGNNVLDGKGGKDELAGLDGDDTYITDGGDTIEEYSDFGGTDTVRSTVSYKLGDYLENLVLLGTAQNGTGNGDANVITGNNSVNVLDGGGGSDQLIGLGGNDTYIVNGGDTVVEVLNGGTDTVKSTITFTLTNYVEKLTLLGTAQGGYGNAQANVITGNASNNIIDGAYGSDTLTGGAGKDAFLFKNTLSSASNRDSITDFKVVDDTIRLENSIFTKLTSTGTLSASFFKTGTAAVDSNDYIVYNKTTGALIYDSNGSGSGGAIQFATLDSGLSLTNADFLVV